MTHANVTYNGSKIEVNIYDGAELDVAIFNTFTNAINYLVSNNFVVKTESQDANGNWSIWFVQEIS